MATSTYMNNRQKYQRPQGILFADNPGVATIKTITDSITVTLSSGEDTFAVSSKTTLKPGYHFTITGEKRGLTDGASGVEVLEVVYVYDSTGTICLSSTIKISQSPTSSGDISLTAGPVVYIPTGDEFDNFIILTDDNRQFIDISYNRIEKRERMINGRMRSYHVADKLNISTNWDMVPSKAFTEGPNILSTGFIENGQRGAIKITTDGGAGGAEMKAWYDNNVGSFWVYLAYDDYKTSGGADSYDRLVGYGQPIEMFFSSFAHTVQKRSGTYDYWNVQLSLEEV